MGLLDDAIREHLELKRQHGADPAEVAQLEREAFGPARRGPEPLEVPPAPAEPEPEPALEAVPEPEPESEPVDPVLIEPEVDAPEYEPLAEPAAPPAPEPAPAPPPEEPAAEGEDVLEETPEFLQETPEHDRLWFEQRPPRDFDFDG
jgi:hypothetical protein